MARLQLSKSSLSRETASLKTYRRFLPSLDLKRQELMARRAKAKAALNETRAEIERFSANLADDFPMLSNEQIDLTDLVKVKAFKLDDENVMGAHLPLLKQVEVVVSHYSMLAKPAWVDGVALRMREMVTLKIRLQVDERRLEMLEVAVRKVTQRVNLFDKVLIPRARGNIKKIKIYLSDSERAGVVNAKLAKQKRLKEAAS